MKQEFISSEGKIINERNILFIKRLNARFHHTIVYELRYPLIFCIWAMIKWFSTEEPFDIFVACIITGLALSHSYPLYDILFKRCLSNRIPLNRINSFELKDGDTVLDRHVILHLDSGRYKKIAFRSLEKQYEPFIELISQQISQPQTV
jgi:hypothetical protein